MPQRIGKKKKKKFLELVRDYSKAARHRLIYKRPSLFYILAKSNWGFEIKNEAPSTAALKKLKWCNY